VKRALVIAGSAVALVLAGLLAAVVPTGSAQSPPATTTTTDATTTSTEPATTETTAVATTTTAAPTTTTAPKPKPKPNPKPKPKPESRPKVLPHGVTIGGVHVGGLAPQAAYAVVRAAFNSPLVLTAGAHKIEVSPVKLGTVAYAKAAVSRAMAARPGTKVVLGVNINGSQVRKLVEALGARYDRPAVDSKLLLRDLKPFITEGAPGKALDAKGAIVAILRALRENRRTGIDLPYRDVQQQVSRSSFGAVIVIRRASNQLYLYDGMKPWRTFTVATGQAIYPTPLGRFEIVVKWKDPWWYPPNSPWAKGAKPIPPGPGNPLGTRWMGLSAPGVGIHGTPDPASLGYSASHGCIRMYIPYAEWLFDRVDIGTPVYIVPA
jgi:lipoprotein-anchoring transpeptidase ErfK/SrfK